MVGKTLLKSFVACAALAVASAGIVEPSFAQTKKKAATKSVIVGLVSAPAEPAATSVQLGTRKKKASSSTSTNITGLNNTGRGAATTVTEILAGKNVAPMFASESASALRAAEERYAEIVAAGGWPKIGKAALKKGSEGEAVAALNQRLNIEGYLRTEAVQGEFASIFTTATEEALARYQRNNGLAVTGRLDGPTINALNVPAQQRLRTIQANIPRLDIYTTNLTGRYLLVNIPAQQIEAVQNGSVYSRHNAVVGRPERPTPVVMTALTKVKFNPYWNAPASIVERDIIPKIQTGGSRVIDDMDITVFRGVGGPEIDPRSVDWDYAIADDFHFRQNPGPKNAMATSKIEFDSPFGIYLHDTPDKQLFKSNGRFYSSGCVRVEQVPVLLNWILNGQDGYNASRISTLADTLEQVDVSLAAPPQLRVAYLTAWPSGGQVAFRNDIYDLDRTGFTVGQPMPIGESHEGLRYTLKPIPRIAAESDGDFSIFSRGFGRTSKGREKGKSFWYESDDEDQASAKTEDAPSKTLILGLNAPSKTTTKTASKSKTKKLAKAKAETPATKTVITGLNGQNTKTTKKPVKKKVASAACKSGDKSAACKTKKQTASN
jgi:murein L,D-transpeptidase YcbB/YkuD